MFFDNLDDYEIEQALIDLPPKTDAGIAQHEAEFLRRAFGTRLPKPLKPSHQDELFNPGPQKRLF